VRAAHWMMHLELDHSHPIWSVWNAGLTRGRWLARLGVSQRDAPPVLLSALVAGLRVVAGAAGLTRFPIFCASQSAAVACLFAARYPDACLGWHCTGASQVLSVRDAAGAPVMTHMIRAGWGKPTTWAMRSLSACSCPMQRWNRRGALQNCKRPRPALIAPLKSVRFLADVVFSDVVRAYRCPPWCCSRHSMRCIRFLRPCCRRDCCVRQTCNPSSVLTMFWCRNGVRPPSARG